MHRLGRLYQRMNRNAEAERAYRLALRINPALPATLNNLAVLRMACVGLPLSRPLASCRFCIAWDPAHERSLLLNSACELRLYQRRPLEARNLAEEQISLLISQEAHVNLSLALRALNDLKGALCHQQRAVQQWCFGDVVTDEALLMSIGHLRSDGLTATIQYHLTLMNFAVARLSIDPLDFQAQQLLLSGSGIEPFSWSDPSFSRDFGVANTLMNWFFGKIRVMAMPSKIFAWIEAISQRVNCLRLFVRASLQRVVQERMSLPSNCTS